MLTMNAVSSCADRARPVCAHTTESDTVGLLHALIGAVAVPVLWRCLLRWLQRLEPVQKNADNRFDMLLIGQAIGQERWEQQLATQLRQQHPHEGARAGTHVMRAQASKLDLAGEVALEEVEDCRDE